MKFSESDFLIKNPNLGIGGWGGGGGRGGGEGAEGKRDG